MKDKRFAVDSLVIEATRRCLSSCEHCLRGDPQDLDMPLQHVDALFDRLSYVSTITFTGGEPALVPETLWRIRESARDHKLDVGNFYIATSTTVSPAIFKRFLLECLEWHLFCSDNEVSQVNWSNDEFHTLNDSFSNV